MELLTQSLSVLTCLAIFLMGGYATGKIKHHFTAIACLITIASIPFLVLLRFPVLRTLDLLSITIWLIVSPLFSIAGHVMGKKANFRSVLLASATVCTCLIVPAYLVYMTHMLDVGFQHQEHVRVDHWEFSLPGRWYVDRAASSVWYQVGAKEALELHRTSWSEPRAQSMILIIRPVPSMISRQLENRNLVQNERFRIEGEYGHCSSTISDQKELRYEEWCQFPDADLAINIEARTEEDLLEAARIVSGARFLKLSDPYSTRQPS
ncbi:MAG TPA: hypothetical protein VGK22_09400 [Candidatus Angelobacter sp.]|jgi:hypothetical protein